MAGKNRYVNMTHISERKFRELLRYFCADIPALTAADLTGLNRNTVNRFYKLFRVRIMELCEQESPFTGEVEVDESYFGAKRVRGK
ncbi:MAG: IS1595 family transposase, partial [Actinomycetaceae bacterium]|nr:IS1595 family transposase [Actinomycetaceae bacterium]